MRQADIPFEEVLIPLYEPGSTDANLKYAPTGKVPCLVEGSLTVWESLSICEFLAEQFPEKQLWPADRALRAEVRSLAAEMHAGFTALRHHCPMNVRRHVPGRTHPSEVGRDLARFSAIVESMRARFAAAGPFLAGQFSIADAMFAPVATRCRTYGLRLPSRSQTWVDHILGLPAMQEWYAAAAEEPWVLPGNEPAEG
jgi:glutathione S-transferase